VDPAELLKAIAFAADKHRHQRRKDAEASPYINHPIGVATVLATERLRARKKDNARSLSSFIFLPTRSWPSRP
jgi:(p)ppGpp synthase/HD superfamily hydrolase